MQERLLNICKEKKLTHISSCLTALPIIQEIYKQKKQEDKFVLSSGHAHLAHALLMGREDLPAGIHCDKENGCDISTGSLGQGLPIALGMALADSSRDVYCLISDGECAEGSIWEALRLKTDLKVVNLKVYVNINGYSAYDEVDTDLLTRRLKSFCPDINIRLTGIDAEILKQYPQLEGLAGHYKTI